MSSLGTFKNEILEELKNVKYDDLEDLGYRFQLTYDEIVGKLDVKYFVGSTKRYTLPPGVYEIIDINFMLKSLLPKEVKVNFTIDDIRLESNLTTNKTIKFTKRSFSRQYYFLLKIPQVKNVLMKDLFNYYQVLTKATNLLTSQKLKKCI